MYTQLLDPFLLFLSDNLVNHRHWIEPLKDKSGVGIIVDYSRDYTVVNGV